MNKSDLEKIQAKADWIAAHMDEAIRIPGTKIRIGWDSILGFIPGVGDVVASFSHGYLFLQGFKIGLRKRVYATMAINAMFDIAIGAIPIVGDILDIFFKSNRRNADLLRREIARKTETRRNDVS